MTRIEIEKNKITINGHAGYGPEGQDIVCSAISILTYTLIGALEDADIDYYEDIRPGHAHIEAFPDNKNFEKSEIIFEVITKGLQILCENFAEFVQM